MAKSRKNEFSTKQLVVVFDVIYLNVVCLLAIKMAIHFDYHLIILNLQPNKKNRCGSSYPTVPNFLPLTLNFFLQILKLKKNIRKECIKMLI